MENRKIENLENDLRVALIYIGVFAFAFTLAGVLALPIILSTFYSWRWFFLYLVYLVVAVDRVEHRRPGLRRRRHAECCRKGASSHDRR